jgi:hypothetical protein
MVRRSRWVLSLVATIDQIRGDAHYTGASFTCATLANRLLRKIEYSNDNITYEIVQAELHLVSSYVSGQGILSVD